MAELCWIAWICCAIWPTAGESRDSSDIVGTASGNTQPANAAPRTLSQRRTGVDQATVALWVTGVNGSVRVGSKGTRLAEVIVFSTSVLVPVSDQLKLAVTGTPGTNVAATGATKEHAVEQLGENVTA